MVQAAFEAPEDPAICAPMRAIPETAALLAQQGLQVGLADQLVDDLAIGALTIDLQDAVKPSMSAVCARRRSISICRSQATSRPVGSTKRRAMACCPLPASETSSVSV
jgi:hypothetical protein